ncbi:MAG: YidH family protein [Novosphingobium sp.]
MAGHSPLEHHDRPVRSHPEDVPDLPQIGADEAPEASTIYSRFRTGLSRRRTGLSEHRTDLSEFRTDLSQLRTELGMRRTGMALQRTRMAADRTLMAEIRTSLSMIAFGFTLYETFRRFAQAMDVAGSNAPRNFGLSLIVLGLLILSGGIWRHIQFANELRARRKELVTDILIHGDSAYPISVSLIVAVGLFVVGILAVLTVAFGLSPFE